MCARLPGLDHPNFFAKTKQARRWIGLWSWESVVAAVGVALLTLTADDARALFVQTGFPRP